MYPLCLVWDVRVGRPRWCSWDFRAAGLSNAPVRTLKWFLKTSNIFMQFHMPV